MSRTEKDEKGALLLAGAERAEPRLIRHPAGWACLASERGPFKDGPNEDAAAFLPIGASAAVLAVADGCGGHAAGDRASRLALDTLAARLRAAGEEAGRAAILDAFEEANAALVRQGIGSATTLSAVLIEGELARPFHAGDSAVLIAGQRGRLKLATLAHAPVAYAVESGLLDAEEAMHHDERSVISNLVGADDMRIEVGAPLALAARDTILLASDGLTDNLTTEEIVERIRKGPLEKAAAALLDLARQRMREPGEGEPSKPDDCTFVLFRRT